MVLSLNKPKLDNLAGDIWKSAERLRGKYKAYEYQSVILPIIIIRRLECVLLTWREAKSAEVLAKRPKLTNTELAKLVKELELNPQQSPFSNKTKWTLRKVYEEDHTLLEENFRAYINGFSKNVDDIIEHFNYRATIGTIGNSDHIAVRVGKAGRLRHKGRKGHSRGSAMNPVDHPMGGGEGRRSGGRDPQSPTGVLAKGGKTRRRRNPANAHIIRRRITRRYGEAKIPK